MKPVKWGIISTANIGMEKVLPGMLKSKDIEIVAISSRKLKSAQAAAAKLGIPKAYGSYEAMLAYLEIEAVYKPAALPSACAPDARRRQGRQACTLRKAHRHVRQGSGQAPQNSQGHLCGRSLHGAPQPAMAGGPRHAKKGDIGEVRAVQVYFTYFNRDPENVRNMADIGGGGLYDIGCYPITVSRFMFGAEPSVSSPPSIGTPSSRLTGWPVASPISAMAAI